MFSTSYWRNTFFSLPKYLPSIVGLSTFIGLLVETCEKLIPLGESRNEAEKLRDQAQDLLDSTARKLKALEAKIAEDKQRIIDLDCSMNTTTGYPRFNRAISDFERRLSESKATPIDQLRSFLQMRFDDDKQTTTQFTTEKSWDELVSKREWVCKQECENDKDGKETCKEVCEWETHYEYETHYYDEITTIKNNFKNILTGPTRDLYALNCGYYARGFKTFSPESYITYESPHIKSGDKERGTTYVNFFRNYGSRFKVSFSLDGKITDSVITVFREFIKIDAATIVISKFHQILSSAYTAFNLTGANYPALQESFREEIPKLINQTVIVKAILQENAADLAVKQAAYDDADNAFWGGLRLWLPMLFLIPPAAALLTYGIISLGNSLTERCRRKVHIIDLDGIDDELIDEPEQEDEPDLESGVPNEQTESQAKTPPSLPSHYSTLFNVNNDNKVTELEISYVPLKGSPPGSPPI
jgi:hypothetical protein